MLYLLSLAWLFPGVLLQGREAGPNDLSRVFSSRNHWHHLPALAIKDFRNWNDLGNHLAQYLNLAEDKSSEGFWDFCRRASEQQSWKLELKSLDLHFSSFHLTNCLECSWNLRLGKQVMQWGGWVKQAELVREGRGKCLKMKKERKDWEGRGETGQEQEKGEEERNRICSKYERCYGLLFKQHLIGLLV